MGGSQNGGMRSRHHSGLDYASDTDALQSPVFSVRGGGINGGRGGGARMGAHPSSHHHHSSRSSSLPRTFQREALLRHPELSMEMDRLASPGSILPHGIPSDDPLSDSGAISAPESVLSARKRGGKARLLLIILFICCKSRARLRNLCLSERNRRGRGIPLCHIYLSHL